MLDPNCKAPNVGNGGRSAGTQNRVYEKFWACFANNYLVNKHHKQNLVSDVL